MIPVIVALHFAWFKLQQNEKLVSRNEQLNEQPLITVSLIKKTTIYYSFALLKSLMIRLIYRHQENIIII